MIRVGIIANPASGKDIRRLVAHGSVFDNNEKVNIVRRVLLGLEAAGVDEVVYMPDYFGIVPRALDGAHAGIAIRELEIATYGEQRDSTESARAMADDGIRCIVTLGGDGTNRAVAKGCGDVPLVPISTGTNNVFPTMVEGTIAGLAAGLVAGGRVDESKAVRRTKRLEVWVDDVLRDLALIDVVVSKELFIASRAIWDMGTVEEILLTRAEPGSIGMSAIGGQLQPVTSADPHGLHLRLGDGPVRVTAAVAPGLIREVPIEAYRSISAGEPLPILRRPCILALDGEREVEVRRQRSVDIRLSLDGPRVVDIRGALTDAARQGVFRKNGVLA